MAVVSMKQLLEAGVHFGHQTRRWNPKWRNSSSLNAMVFISLVVLKQLKRVEKLAQFLCVKLLPKAK